MKKNTLLKSILVILLSWALVLSFTGYVAADDDDYDWDDATVTTNNSTNDTTNNTTDDDTNNTTNDTTNNTTNDTSNNTTNSTTNSTDDDEEEDADEEDNTSSNNSLVYTGSSETKGMILLIFVIAGIVTVCSYKKLNEYKNL